MSVIAGMNSYDAEVYTAVQAKGTFSPPNKAEKLHCFLDRSWDELHPAFKSFGPPLSLALNGDYTPAGGLDRFGWDKEDESSCYLAFVSPALTAEIAARLATLTFKQLAKKLDEPSRGRKYLAPFFQELVEFYTATAAAGDCVFIHVA